MNTHPSHQSCLYEPKLEWRDVHGGHPEALFLDMECEHGYSATGPFRVADLPDELAELGARHKPYTTTYRRVICEVDGQSWPCDAARLYGALT